MSVCPGKVGGRIGQHAGSVFRCSKCGAVGCREERCTNHNFTGSGRCNRCGHYQTYKQI